MVILIIFSVLIVLLIIIGTAQVTPEMIASEKRMMAEIKAAKMANVNIEAVKSEVVAEAMANKETEKAKKNSLKAEAKAKKEKAEEKAKKELEKQEINTKKALIKKARALKGRTASEKVAVLEEMYAAKEITDEEYKAMKNILIMEV